MSILWEKNLSGNQYADAYDLALAGCVWDPLLDQEDDSNGDGKPDDVLSV